MSLSQINQMVCFIPHKFKERAILHYTYPSQNVVFCNSDYLHSNKFIIPFYCLDNIHAAFNTISFLIFIFHI